MDYLWTGLFAVIALSWIVQGIGAARGVATLPRLDDAELLSDDECPRISILVAARNEAHKLRKALGTLLTQDYPSYEVLAINDRSTDSTGEILDQFAAKHRHLRVIHIRELPPGWLGKPHALTTAYENSTGEWLVFTDADVRFAPDLLRRTVSMALAKGWQHQTVFPLADLESFWEKTAVSYWLGAFVTGSRIWQVSDPNSRAYVGAGAFQLVLRTAYETVGTHRRLAMEVVEDLKLGKLLKLGGFSSGVTLGQERLRIRWTSGLREFVSNLTKNMFAACGFSVSYVLFILLLILAHTLLPVVAMAFASGIPRLLAAICILAGAVAHLNNGVRLTRVSSFYAFTFPLGATLLMYVFLRSMVVTLRQGGIVWRETFYPLEDLRRGMI